MVLYHNLLIYWLEVRTHFMSSLSICMKLLGNFASNNLGCINGKNKIILTMFVTYY